MPFSDIVVALFDNADAVLDTEVGEGEWDAHGSLGIRGWVTATLMMAALCRVSTELRRSVLDLVRNKSGVHKIRALAGRITAGELSELVAFVEARPTIALHINGIVGLLQVEWTAAHAQGMDSRSIALAAVVDSITVLVPGEPGTTDMLLQVGRFCPKLVCLDLQEFGGESNSPAVRVVEDGEAMLQLRVAALAAVTASCKQLKELDMHSFLCQPYTETAVADVVQNCASLTSLSLESCQAGDSWPLLHAGLPKLVTLNLSWSGIMPSRDMRELVAARYPIGLRLLILEGTRLTQATEEFLHSQYPELNLYHGAFDEGEHGYGDEASSDEAS